MRSKSHLQPEPEADSGRRGAKLEFSPVRAPSGGRATAGRAGDRAARASTATRRGAGPSPGPTSGHSPGPGRTPQTKRRELSLTAAEKNSPSGSPRRSGTATRKTGHAKLRTDRDANSSEESARKSSNSSQDSGIGGGSKPSRLDRTRNSTGGGARPGRLSAAQQRPQRTVSPDTVSVEVSNRKKFEELCDVKNVELGIVKVPAHVLDELIHKENIDKFYDVDAIPVAR